MDQESEPGSRALYDAGGRSEPKLLELLQTLGIHRSRRQLSDLLIKDHKPFHAQREAGVRAGLASSRRPHLESTGRRVNGKNEHWHVLGNPLSTASWTLPAQERLSLLRVLEGGAEPAFRLKEVADSLLPQFGLAHQWCQKLSQVLPCQQDWRENQRDAFLDET